MRKVFILISFVVLGLGVKAQSIKTFTSVTDSFDYKLIIEKYFSSTETYDYRDSIFRDSYNNMLLFTESDSIVNSFRFVDSMIKLNYPAVEISRLYAFRHVVDSFYTIKHKLLSDYWRRQRYMAMADTGLISSEDTLFLDIMETLAYQDTINLDSILNELEPYTETLLRAIDNAIEDFKINHWVKWIENIRNDTVNFYIVNSDGDSMLVRLYDKRPDIVRFGITDYWGSGMPAVLRDINKNSFKLLIDDTPELDYATDEKAKEIFGNLNKGDTNCLQLTLKPLKVDIPKPDWIIGGNVKVDISQVGMYQWAQGGDPTISLLAGVELFALYKRDNLNWDNRARFRYGRIRQGRYKDNQVKFRSLEDKMEFVSKFGYRAFGEYFVSFSGDFKSQFANTYDWDGNERGDKISDFMSPAYLTFSLGLDYKPYKNTTLFLSPLASKNTFVLDTSKVIKDKFGVDPNMRHRSEVGMRFKAFHKFNVWEDIKMTNELELFSNYLEDPQNVDINWEMNVIFPVNDYIKATVTTNFIYDDNTTVPKYVIENGEEVRKDGPGGQFREMITIGFSVLF